MPIFINLDNVLTLERQDDVTTVVMVGGEKVYIDTMPETLIGAVAPAGPVWLAEAVLNVSPHNTRRSGA